MKESFENAPKNKNKKKESSKDWLNNIHPDKVIGNAQRIITTAVDVLEEEIAAGILAAKKLEKKVIDVDELRSVNPGELMSRIRRDTHDAIDIFLDALTVITNHLGNLSETFNRVKENETEKKNDHRISVIKHDGPVQAGDSIEIPVVLTNESIDQQMPVELNKTEMTGPGGNKILGRNINILPRSFMLEPGAKQEVKIKIRIPQSCKPGTYSGLFQDNMNPNLRTVVTVDIS